MTALDFPSSPSNGDTYENYVYDATAGVWKRVPAGVDLNDITDVTLTSPTDGQALVYDNATSNWVNGEGSSVPVAVSETAPVSPEVGELWLNSTEAKMYVYYDDGTSAQWVAAVGGTVPSQGKILQVVSAIRSEPSSASITTAGDFIALTGLSASITPSSTSSKVLVLVSVSFAPRSVTQNSRTFYRLMRDSTPIGNGDTASSRTSAFTGLYVNGDGDVAQGAANYLDSPNTTSAVTYSVQGTSSASSDSIVINRSSADADLLGRARTASYITLLEVAG